ncbi:ATPase [Vineibacter terrae]|uniref:ATPase n=1 Tax=Vineibacter terrae TaxID=2586908 RepID=A0A5C8PML1_9HYPH|nr:ATP12 family protein [Vineibacter terrae]TXL74605.1 ATPase [Vineibacter terrae]
MKRFYKTVTVAPATGGFEVRLDNRPIRTPAARPLILPTEALAAEIAQEWTEQPEKGEIKPLEMGLMRLAATAIDRVTGQRHKVIDDTARYAGSDLLCYRADTPTDLVVRQARVWQPLLDWAATRYAAPLELAAGIRHRPQPPESLAALVQAVAAHSDFGLSALFNLTTAMGSVVLALAVSERHLDPSAAFEAAELDALYEIEKWGDDSEAIQRHQRLRRDIGAGARFLELLGSARIL